MNIISIIKSNYDYIVKAIMSHFNEHMLSPYSHELRMFIDNSGTVSFETGLSGNTNDIWVNGHYVLCKAGGFLNSPWYYLGDIRFLLDYDDLISIIEDIPTRPISKRLVEAYIEENYPELIQEWIEEYHDNHYDTELENAQNILDDFILSLDD